jgi:phosphoglycerate dehydrogenase-like enzyme
MASKFKVGITRDAMRADGTPVFDARALDIFKREPNIEFEFLAEKVTALTPAHTAAYDGLCVLMPKVTRASLSGKDKRVCILARHGVGYDSIDVPACSETGVILTITPDGVRRPVASSVVLFVLALSHKLFTKDMLTKTGRWAETTNHMGEGLIGKTIGSIGVGNIGKEIFRLIKPWNMVHLGYDPYLKQSDVDDLGVKLVDKETLLRESDFVTVNCPLNNDTRGIVGANEFKLMKKTAYLINTSRGPTVDEKAAYHALKDGAIAGAALDVFEQEPTPGDNAILKLPNVIATPHSICWTDECFRMIAESVFTSVVDVANGRVPKYVVNREVLKHPAIVGRMAAQR